MAAGIIRAEQRQLHLGEGDQRGNQWQHQVEPGSPEEQGQSSLDHPARQALTAGIFDDGRSHGLTPRSGLTQVARCRRGRSSALGRATTSVSMLISQYTSGYQSIQ